MPEGRYVLRSHSRINESSGGRYELRSNSGHVVISAGDKIRKIWSVHQSGGIQEVAEVPKEDFVFGSGVCALPDDVIEGGGLALTGGERRSACSQLQFSTSVWSPLPGLSAPRWGHGSACMRGRMFVIGGSLPCEWTGNVDFLDMAELEQGWQVAPAAPESLYCPKVAVLGAHIYALDDYTGKLFCMDAEVGEWSCRAGLGGAGLGGAGLRGPVRGSSMAALDGKLYLAGKMCRVYDPCTDTWNSAPPPSQEHNYGSMVRWGKHALILAGGDTDALEIYDVKNNAWSDAGYRLPGKTSFSHAFALNN